MISFVNFLQNFGQAATASCKPGTEILGVFPTWYKYLPGQLLTDSIGGLQCIPQISSINDVWLIVAAVTDMLLRIAVMVATVFIIVGGVRYISSQGLPDKTAQARDTIIKSVVGMVIALASATVLTYVVGQVIK